MKKTTFLLKLLFLSIAVFAQDLKTSVISYKQVQSFGMGEPKGISYKATLIFNSNCSTYIFAKDSLEGEHIEKIKLVYKNDFQAFFIPKSTTRTGFVYHMNRKTKVMRCRDIGFNYIKDEIPPINWVIMKEKKKIGNYICTKATCFFSGRYYTAWFSPEVPVQHGPWKLQGLPGLILEAYDLNKEILFSFDYLKFENKNNLKLFIPNPKNNTDFEKTKPSTQRNWISSKQFEEEMIKRHIISTKNGKIFMEKTFTNSNSDEKNRMKKFYIEIFDEKGEIIN